MIGERDFMGEAELDLKMIGAAPHNNDAPGSEVIPFETEISLPLRPNLSKGTTVQEPQGSVTLKIAWTPFQAISSMGSSNASDRGSTRLPLTASLSTDSSDEKSILEKRKKTQYDEVSGIEHKKNKKMDLSLTEPVTKKAYYS